MRPSKYPTYSAVGRLAILHWLKHEDTPEFTMWRGGHKFTYRRFAQFGGRGGIHAAINSEDSRDSVVSERIWEAKDCQ